MGIADRIYEVVKGMPDPEARRILQFAESVKACSVTDTLISHYSGSIAGATME